MQANWVVAPFRLEQTPFVSLQPNTPTSLDIPVAFVGDSPEKGHTIVILQVFGSGHLVVNNRTYRVGGYNCLLNLYVIGNISSNRVFVSVMALNTGISVRISGVFNSSVILFPSGGPGSVVQCYTLVDSGSFYVGSCMVAGYTFQLPSVGPHVPQSGLDNLYGFFGDVFFLEDPLCSEYPNYVPFVHPTLSFPGSTCSDIECLLVGEQSTSQAQFRYNTFHHLTKEEDNYFVYHLKGLHYGNVPTAVSPFRLVINGWLRKDVIDSNSQPLIICLSPFFDSNSANYLAGFLGNTDILEDLREFIVAPDIVGDPLINRQNLVAGIVVNPSGEGLIPVKDTSEAIAYHNPSLFPGAEVDSFSTSTGICYFGSISIDFTAEKLVVDSGSVVDSITLNWGDEDTISRGYEFVYAFDVLSDGYYPWLLGFANSTDPEGPSDLSCYRYYLPSLTYIGVNTYQDMRIKVGGFVSFAIDNYFLYMFGVSASNYSWIYQLAKIDVFSREITATFSISDLYEGASLEIGSYHNIATENDIVYLKAGGGLCRVNMSTLSGSIIAIGNSYNPIYLDSDGLWIGLSGEIKKLDKQTLETVAIIPLDGVASGLIVDPNYFYILRYDSTYSTYSVRRIDRITLESTSLNLPIIASPSTFSRDLNGNFWVGGFMSLGSGGYIYKIYSITPTLSIDKEILVPEVGDSDSVRVDFYIDISVNENNGLLVFTEIQNDIGDKKCIWISSTISERFIKWLSAECIVPLRRSRNGKTTISFLEVY